MRYLGNKTSIVDQIKELLSKKKLLNKDLVFFDAFCGSGSVSDYLKDEFNIIINDNLKWSVIYTHGRICASNCSFSQLGFDPFDYLNSSKKKVRGFITKNYSPAYSDRMYFTKSNAERIDYFRFQIEEWYSDKLLSYDEYCFLLASLIESVSHVSNTAGVYGAFLKHWDSRATKDIIFERVDYKESKAPILKEYTEKIENIIENVDCDILYLDPPYTQNQYGTQYHLLETLILNDNPEISKITGSRPTAPMRSDWSKDIKAHILFDKVVAETKAKYILFSYNNDGFMSKDYIEAVLKRYGKKETYTCKKIAYKKYQNWKSQNKKEHFEYLFFVEKKSVSDIFFEAPLNYTGSKAKIVSDIINESPSCFNTFFDLFAGGFNVGANFINHKVQYNDLNYFVKEIIESLYLKDTYQYIKYMRRVISDYSLEKGNADSYIKARDYYNNLQSDRKDPRFLLTIILYGFQQQIRFNSNHEFNNPVGMRWFNDKILEKMISFSRHIKQGDVQFECKSYSEYLSIISSADFVYLDPPYRLTTGAYNDGKRGFNGWDENQEKELFEFCDGLNNKDVRFMLSYVIEHRGKKNNNLIEWSKKNNYKIVELGSIIGISGSKRKEILVKNYE